MRTYIDKIVVEKTVVGFSCDICGENMAPSNEYCEGFQICHSDADLDCPRDDSEVCVKCYKEKVIPALEALGCRFIKRKEPSEIAPFLSRIY